MIVIGLTGSIAMGKSTAAQMLQHLKVPVHDSDAAVHKALQPGETGMRAIFAAFPYFEYPQIYKRNKKGSPRILNRSALGDVVFAKDEARSRLEKILHPLVHQDQVAFLRKHRAMGCRIVALDIPLLFEIGAEALCDYTVVVSAPAGIQRSRVLFRPGMSAEKLSGILQRQMPDGEKRARADFVVQTGLGRAVTMKQIRQVLHEIRSREFNTEKTQQKDERERSKNSRDLCPSEDRRAGSVDQRTGFARHKTGYRYNA